MHITILRDENSEPIEGRPNPNGVALAEAVEAILIDHGSLRSFVFLAAGFFCDCDPILVLQIMAETEQVRPLSPHLPRSLD